MRFISSVILHLLLGTFLFGLNTIQAQNKKKEYKETDQLIDESFAPISNAIQNIIFYSFTVSEEVLYAKRDANDKRGITLPIGFYKSPPFTISYNKGEVNAGSAYKIKAINDEEYTLKYGATYQKDLDNQYYVVRDTSLFLTAKFGESVSLKPIDGFDFDTATFTVNKNVDSNFPMNKNYYQFSVNKVSVPFVLIWLMLGAIFFTIYLKFINIRGFKTAIDIVRGKYDDPDNPGEVSHFQALTAALSGTVGLGNIAGVAIAISLGGPGATFWMIVAGLLGMSSKLVECTLGVKYRQIGSDGRVFGGPMYYLRDGLKKRNMEGLGKVLAVFFAIMCIGGSFGGGNMFQANQAYQQFAGLMPNNIVAGGSSGVVFGIVMAVLVGIVIIGGIKSIARVTEKIVPFMVGIYVSAALVVLLSHVGEIPAAFGKIFSGAFSPEAIAGGVIGVLIQGIKRAAFSNEAGIGSASIAHSAVKTNDAASEGFVALLEPFIDTVVVCTMTALVIIITGMYTNVDGLSGVDLTSDAFGSVLSWFPGILTIAVILFAFSTMISWSYYGAQSWAFLFGKSKVADYSYKLIFCLFVVIGSAASLGSVVGFSDAMIFAMCFPNVLGLYILGGEVKEEINDYLHRIETGEIKRQD